MVEIIPSVLTNDSTEALRLIKKAENKVKRVQIDFVDGKFFDNKTLDLKAFSRIQTNLFFDFHLMAEEPIDFIFECNNKEGARIIGQIERMRDQEQFVKAVKAINVKVGLGVDLETPLSKLNANLFSELDVILLMSVKAGLGGQEFDESVYIKIKELREKRTKNNYKFLICVDGGVTYELIPALNEIGVDEAIMGRRWYEKNS